jgi:hypothetical protein
MRPTRPGTLAAAPLEDRASPPPGLVQIGDELSKLRTRSAPTSLGVDSADLAFLRGNFMKRSMIDSLPGRALTAAFPLSLALVLSSASAAAQPAPAAPAAPPAAAPQGAPAAPPPGYGQPPPGYGQPPPGYGPPQGGYYPPPPGYGQPPPGYGPPQGGYYPPPGGYYYPPPGAMMPVLTLPYEEGDPIPQGFAVKSRANRPLLIAGSITFGAPYLISVLIAATVVSASNSDGGEFAPMFVPIVGPFITIGTAHAEGAGTFWLIFDGLAQAGGAAMFIAGLTMEEKYLQRTAPRASLKPEVIVNPGAMKLKWTF